jgi:hypothetical protein
MVNFLCEFKIRYESIWTGNGPFDNFPFLLTHIIQCRREEQNDSRCQRGSVVPNGSPICTKMRIFVSFEKKNLYLS